MSEPVDFVSEVSDLAAGATILLFTLAPFALPFLALTVLVAAMLLIPALLGAVLVSPLVIVWRWWRSRDRASGNQHNRQRTGKLVASAAAK